MARNRNSKKNYEDEGRTGGMPENRGNRKLPENKSGNMDSMSTAGDTSSPKYSKTSVRKEDKERRPNSDGTRWQ